MRHHCATSKLGRTRAHRDAMLANMAASLIRHGRIETTLPKAKVLRSIADRMVTLGKRGTVAARRRAISIIRDKKAVKIAFDDLAPRFAERQGGYTRLLKLGWRHGDAAPMAAIEYLGAEGRAVAADEAEHGRKKAAVKADAEKRHVKTAKSNAKKFAVKKVAKPHAEKRAKMANPHTRKVASKGKSSREG